MSVEEWGLASAPALAQAWVEAWEWASVAASERASASGLAREWGQASAALLAQVLVEKWAPVWAAA